MKIDLTKVTIAKKDKMRIVPEAGSKIKPMALTISENTDPQQERAISVIEMLKTLEIERATEGTHLPESDESVLNRFNAGITALHDKMTEHTKGELSFTIPDANDTGMQVVRLVQTIRLNPGVFMDIKPEDVGLLTLAARQTYAKLKQEKVNKSKKKTAKEVQAQDVADKLSGLDFSL